MGKLETVFGDIVPVSSVILLERFAIHNHIGEFGDVHEHLHDMLKVFECGSRMDDGERQQRERIVRDLLASQQTRVLGRCDIVSRCLRLDSAIQKSLDDGNGFLLFWSVPGIFEI